MSSRKFYPISDHRLISNVPKWRWRCIKDPQFYIPQITNLYSISSDVYQIPLKYMQLYWDISGSSSSVYFVQVYKNDSPNPIEWVYKFPSHSSFTVVGMKAKIGENTIETKVMEKEKAKERYDDAIAAGHTAVKLNYDEKLPDVIELNIGQLHPDVSAEITVMMVWELEVFKHGFFSFIFP